MALDDNQNNYSVPSTVTMKMITSHHSIINLFSPQTTSPLFHHYLFATVRPENTLHSDMETKQQTPKVHDERTQHKANKYLDKSIPARTSVNRKIAVQTRFLFSCTKSDEDSFFKFAQQLNLKKSDGNELVCLRPVSCTVRWFCLAFTLY